MRPDIEITIDELVLHGFPPGDKLRIARAVERELARLMAREEAPALLHQQGEIERIEGGSFGLPQRSRPDRVGAEIARSVYGGLNR